MRQFLFLYPIEEYLEFEISQGSRGFRPKDSYTGDPIDEFREFYMNTLNSCIDERYRQHGFRINYAVFDDRRVHDDIEIRTADNIIKVGLDFEEHTTEDPDGEFPYPESDYIIDQLGNTSELRVTGFHLWDCVQKVARRAHERGIDTLVDEDLTEIFTLRLTDDDFKIDEYPTYDAREKQGNMFDMFMEVRKDKPWMWQDY